MVASTAGRIDRLLALLAEDPRNPTLLADAASAAFDDGRFDLSRELVDRRAREAPPSAELMNLAGLAAMRQARFDEAAERFMAACDVAGGASEPRYNLAWALAAKRDWTRADEILDESVTNEIPAAATLKVQVLHHLARLDDALAWGATQADRHVANAPLMGALSVVAMDAEDLAQAEAYARRGQASPDGLATLGMLLLAEDRLEDAEHRFEEALERAPGTARALLGRGLASMSAGDPARAGPILDRAANIFGDHLGSWIAAGWAYVLSGDRDKARQRFETARELDPKFAEAHGAIAVLDAMAGRFDEARNGATRALKLDRQCFSGLLARSLVLDSAGRVDAAQDLRKKAMDSPVGLSGRTIAQALARLNPGDKQD